MHNYITRAPQKASLHRPAAGFLDTPAMKLRCAYLTMHRTFDAHFARLGATADQFVFLKALAEE